MRHRTLTTVLGAALLLASCAHQPAPRVSNGPEPGAGLLSGAACLAQLDDDGVVFRSVPPPDAPHPCGIDTPVAVARDGDPFARPVLMGCALADRVWRWETDVVEPAAQRDFGQPVRMIVDRGAFACRREIGSHRAYVSMHAYGLAIDIAGWTLADGRPVTVGRNWPAGEAGSRFLHEVATGACRYFSVVLTPAVNAAHRDHLHLDIGPYRYCGIGKEI